MEKIITKTCQIVEENWRILRENYSKFPKIAEIGEKLAENHCFGEQKKQNAKSEKIIIIIRMFLANGTQILEEIRCFEHKNLSNFHQFLNQIWSKLSEISPVKKLIRNELLKSNQNEVQISDLIGAVLAKLRLFNSNFEFGAKTLRRRAKRQQDERMQILIGLFCVFAVVVFWQQFSQNIFAILDTPFLWIALLFAVLGKFFNFQL